MHLIVQRPFAHYSAGDVIADKAEIEASLRDNADKVVKAEDSPTEKEG